MMTQKEIQPSMILALKVWWASFWRAMPVVLIGSFIVGFIIGMISHFIGLDQKVAVIISAVMGGAVGLFFSVYIFKRLMVKGFGKYRLAVLEKE